MDAARLHSSLAEPGPAGPLRPGSTHRVGNGQMPVLVLFRVGIGHV
jgi:hypothetical protein